MADDSIRRELEELRAQLDALKATQEVDPEPGDSKVGHSPGGDAIDTGSDEASAAAANIASHVHEFVEDLEQDLKGTKRTTLLLVFALGVIVGRLIPR